MPVAGVHLQPVTLPIPVGTSYVGNGSEGIRVHPSPWCNPFAFLTASAGDAKAQLRAYALARADLRPWLAHLSAQTLLAEAGKAGSHVEVIVDLIAGLAGKTIIDLTDPTADQEADARPGGRSGQVRRWQGHGPRCRAGHRGPRRGLPKRVVWPTWPVVLLGPPWLGGVVPGRTLTRRVWRENGPVAPDPNPASPHGVTLCSKRGTEASCGDGTVPSTDVREGPFEVGPSPNVGVGSTSFGDGSVTLTAERGSAGSKPPRPCPG